MYRTLTSIRLSRLPVTVSRYARKEVAQGETRSHGFFYQPESEYDGLLGLPISGGSQAAGRPLRNSLTAVRYLRNRGLSLSRLGTLDGRPSTGNGNDGCLASCVDRYGSSRLLFVRGRAFALLGYEIVEGRVAQARIVETRRLDFAPAVLQVLPWSGGQGAGAAKAVAAATFKLESQLPERARPGTNHDEKR